MNKQALNQKAKEFNAKRDSYPLSRNAVIIRALYNLYDSYINMLYYPKNNCTGHGNNEISKDTPINFYKQDLIVIKNKYKIPEIVLQDLNRIAIDHWHERNTI